MPVLLTLTPFALKFFWPQGNSMAKQAKRKSGPVQRAFLKGLAIILPAVITIAIFAWVWDILRVYVVELTIKVIDSVEVSGPRSLSDVELKYLDDGFFNKSIDATGQYVVKPEGRVESNLRKMPAISDLPPSHRGYSPPGERRSVLQVILDANGWRRDYDSSGNVEVYGYNWFDDLLASIVGMALVVVLGFLARNYFGRKLVSLLEWFVTRVPVVKSIYPHAKQLVEFFFTDNKPIEFETVAVLEYPRRGLWSIVFVTGTGLRSVQEFTQKRMVTVYVPSSPAPMTGYTMVVAADDVIQIDISVEEAMKYVISGGVLAPKDEMVRPQSGAQLALAGSINEQIRRRHTSMLRKSQLLRKVEDEVTQANEESDRQTAAPQSGEGGSDKPKP
jgi:uncharacterized membrane protein